MHRRHFLLGSLALPVLVTAQAPQSSMRVVLLGQALLQHNLSNAQWPSASEFTSLFSDADAVFTDLETAIKGAHADKPTREGEFLHAADTGVIDRLASIGVNLYATSNNHAFDFGPGGIRDAIEALDARGLTHAGTGLNLVAAAAPAYRKTAVGTVALVAMASGSEAAGAVVGAMATATQPGVNEVRRASTGDLDETDVSRYLASIRDAATKADVVIAYQHNHYWEKNMADTPQWQRSLARRAIDAGASIFVAHGAPLLHGIEIFRGKPIFYDLGGFFFQTVTKPGTYPPEVWQSVVVDCRCTKAGFERIALTPVQMNDTGMGGPQDMVTRGMPRIAEGIEGKAILERLARISAPYGTQFKFTPRGAEIVVA